jgi:hypothetical protein
LQRVTIGDGFRLDLSNPEDKKITETLNAPGDKLLGTSVAPGSADRGAQELPICLDAVASDLGLDFKWQQQVRFALNASGTVTTVSDATGKTLLYILNYYPVRVGFLPSGKALFYEMTMSMDADPIVSSDSDLLDSVMTEMTGTAPNHVLITFDGRVCAYTPKASLGAIQSFWIAKDATGNIVHAYRKAGGKGATSPATSTNSKAHSVTTTASAVRRRLRPVPDCTYVDNSYSVTYTSDYGSDTYWTDSGYWDCSGSSYDSTAPDLTAGGGGGGGAGSGNQVTGDAILNLKVNQALSNAQNKLQNLSSNCVQQILSLNANGNTLATNLQNMSGGPWSPYAYMSQVLSYVNGYTNGVCGTGAVAWMNGTFQTTVNVCTSFSNLGTGMEGNRLIHEFLHSIGLPESPSTSGAMTSAQINALVDGACGTN